METNNWNTAVLFKVLTRFSFVLMGLSLSACLPAETESQSSVSSSSATGAQAATRAASATSDPVVTITFGGGSTRWNNDGGVLVYRFAAIERDGEVFVCGAYGEEGRSYVSQFNRELLRRSTVTVNGETVLQNLGFFRKAPKEMLDSQLVGSETRCRTTGLAAGSVALEDVKVELRPGRIRIRV